MTVEQENLLLHVGSTQPHTPPLPPPLIPSSGPEVNRRACRGRVVEIGNEGWLLRTGRLNDTTEPHQPLMFLIPKAQSQRLEAPR